ncbi:MAG: biopolymer transporter ExbD [Magnetococcales bacterium]|nr:biopolymer transporter ExbD [Magnetococcales bacterium]
MRFRARQRIPLRVDLTPLIDVVFLLVLFFMLTTTFATQAGLSIDLPESEQAEKLQEGGKEHRITITVDAWGQFFVQERGVEPEQLAARLREAAGGDLQALVIVQGDQEAKHGQIVKIMDTAQSLGLTRLAIQTRGADEAPLSSPKGDFDEDKDLRTPSQRSN